MILNFLSGLPRSGSTLLASLLRQNPSVHASIMSPVGRMVSSTFDAMGASNEASSFLDDDARVRVLRGLFASFYEPASYVFDNNRRWCANTDLLARLYPGSKIVCCVRTPAAIVDSFERLYRANPLSVSIIYGGRSNLTVYERVQDLMKPDGVLGYALHAFRDAYYGPARDSLLLVNYDDLCRFPGRVMADLHAALHLPDFAYDFNKIEPIPGAKQFDADVQTPGLHDLKTRVVYETRQTILPPDLYGALPGPFWRVKEEATPAA